LLKSIFKNILQPHNYWFCLNVLVQDIMNSEEFPKGHLLLLKCLFIECFCRKPTHEKNLILWAPEAVSSWNIEQKCNFDQVISRSFVCF